MILPRRLYRTASGEFCEEDDVRQAFVYGPKGRVIHETEAERIGLKAYLDRTGYGDVAQAEPAAAEAKAVAQTELEDKALAQTETENKGEELPPGLHIDPALRRGRRA